MLHYAIADECDGDTQLEMHQCADAGLKLAEQQLGAVLTALKVKMNTTSQQHLREAKQAWLDYREKQCGFESDGTKGGSIHSMIALQCYTGITRDYIKRLQVQLECKEGNLSCAH